MPRRFLNWIGIPEVARPGAAPPQGQVDLYAKADGRLYSQRSNGDEILLSGADYRHGSAAATVPKIWSGVASTDGNGDATFTLPSGFFSVVHVAMATPYRTVNLGTESATAFTRSISTSQIIVRANLVLAASMTTQSGIVIHLLVIGA